MKKLRVTFGTGLLALTCLVKAGPSAQAVSDLFDEKFLSGSVAVDWSRDLFRKVPGYAVQSPETSEGLRLEAILYSESDPVAVINGHTLSVGDFVREREIRKIGKNFVLLGRGDSLVELAIPVESQQR